MADDSMKIEIALADFSRSYQHVYLALAEAASPLLDVDRVERARTFEAALVRRNDDIDRVAVLDLLMALTCYLAAKMGSTPRRVHDELFQLAPSDEWWRERVEG